MQEAKAAGIGLCLCPGELPPIHEPWFLDNGAFRAWMADRPFDAQAFEACLPDAGARKPDFVVVPDIVGGGLASPAFCSSWDRRGLHRLEPAALDRRQVEVVSPRATAARRATPDAPMVTVPTARLIELLDQGLSVNAVAQAVGLTPTPVWQRLKRAGRQRRND